jgi:hypothetical protein
MAAEIRAEPELATAEPTVIWTPGSNPAQWSLLQCPVFAPRAERPATPKQLTRDNPRYRPSSKIVGGHPWPSLLSSLRPVLCAHKSGLPSSSFCVFVHCQCAICDLKFTMGFAAKPDTIKQADIDCFSL